MRPIHEGPNNFLTKPSNQNRFFCCTRILQWACRTLCKTIPLSSASTASDTVAVAAAAETAVAAAETAVAAAVFYLRMCKDKADCHIWYKSLPF